MSSAPVLVKCVMQIIFNDYELEFITKLQNISNDFASAFVPHGALGAAQVCRMWAGLDKPFLQFRIAHREWTNRQFTIVNSHRLIVSIFPGEKHPIIAVKCYLKSDNNYRNIVFAHASAFNEWHPEEHHFKVILDTEHDYLCANKMTLRDLARNFGPNHFLATIDFNKKYDIEFIKQAFAAYIPK
jgi:hypothetical protein